MEGRVDIVVGRAPLAALDGAADRIEEELLSAGVATGSIGFDHSRDIIEVLVSTADADIAERAASRASGEFDLPADVVHVTATDGEVVVEELSACTSRLRCDPPFRGGLKLGPICTAGFIAENPAGLYYTMTAGHCGSRTYTHRTDTQGTRDVGGAPVSGTFTETGRDGDGNVVQQNSRVDAARIYMPNTDFWRMGRNVFLYSNTNYSTMLHAWSCPANLPQRTFLHRAGGISGTSTGTVRDPMATYWIDGIPRRDKLLAGYGDDDGDSGAPVLVRSDSNGVPSGTGIAVHKGRVTLDGQTSRGCPVTSGSWRMCWRSGCATA